MKKNQKNSHSVRKNQIVFQIISGLYIVLKLSNSVSRNKQERPKRDALVYLLAIHYTALKRVNL